jgi:hypothetical protein
MGYKSREARPLSCSTLAQLVQGTGSSPLLTTLQRLGDIHTFNKMLIQETHKDVPTKADGKEGSMSKSQIATPQTGLTCFRDLPLPPHYSQLSECVCSPDTIWEDRN